MSQDLQNPSISSPQKNSSTQIQITPDQQHASNPDTHNPNSNLQDHKDDIFSRSFQNEHVVKNDNFGNQSPIAVKDIDTSDIDINGYQNMLKLPSHEIDGEHNQLNLKIKENSSTHSSEFIQSEELKDELRPALLMRSRPEILNKKSEEIKRKVSTETATSRLELKEPNSAELRSNKEESGASFLSDIVISKKRGADDNKKTNFMARSLLPSKPVTISLTFDAFVDQVKGHHYEQSSIASTYPSYKIDKRLIFLGKEVDYPWHIISYHSTFRKLWNIFIIIVIIYEIFWYPVVVAFNYGEPWPLGNFIFEIVSIVIFLLDIIINLRSTYSNENNEEIIDGKMMRNNYMSTRLFKIDIITTFPLPEILLMILIGSSHQWNVYSIVILLRMLRCLKISAYLQNRTMRVIFKLLRIFITFFIIVHWVSCLWYIVIKAEFPGTPTADESLWFPNNLRMVATGDDDLLSYYYSMETVKVYGYTLLSVFMLVVGSDMAPTTDVQIWFSVLIGLFGAVSLAYIFATVTLTINRANQENLLYQQQLEELQRKLRINKIPHNLRVKVMEYFYYSWRKHSVLKKMDDFSELSLPLQRDIALYQHQEMIMKVPLFKELDPVEILSIVQKLKTSIYMPGDRIIREGEKGNEMFFIQEGIAEMMIKKAALKGENTNTKPKYERVFLEKGNYFGEVALMSNSKRTFDVNAFEFCILYSFSKSDYESLKSEFKDIGPRLRSGLKHYKNTHMDQLIQILKNLDIFQNFTDQELRKIGAEYLEEVFVDPDKVVLAPKDRINAIYVIFAGNVKCFSNDEETRNYVHYLRRSDDKNNWTIVDMDEEEEIDCLDDDILNLEKDKLSMDDQKNRLNLIRTYTYGEYFGTLDFDVNEIKCNKYYLTDSGCQIGAITQSLKSQMAIEDPELYEKFRNNVIRWCPRRVMMPIEEEDDSSFTTRNNTIVKLKANRRQSISSDDGKRPVLIRASNANKEEDMGVIKGDLQQLEEEMSHFRTLISGLNARLSNMALNSQDIILGEPSPSKLKPRSLIFGQTGNTVKIPRKTFSEKEMPRILMGVDEVDQIEESQSIRKEEVWPLN